MGFSELLNFISLGMIENSAITVLIGTFFFGDEMVYFFSFLAGQGFFSLWVVILFSILGNGGCDIFWLSVARFGIFKNLKKFIKSKESKENLDNEKLIEKDLGKKKMFFLLLFSKFFYGTRLLAIFYVAKKGKDFKKIIFFNTLAVITWVFVVANLLFLIGGLFLVSVDNLTSVNRMVSLAVLFVITVYILNKFFISKIIKNWLKKKRLFKI